MQIRFRYVALITAAILMPLAYITGETVEAVLAFFAGMLSGFTIDCIGVGKLKLWRYPRQEFLSKEYFSLVVTAWGVFGMTINLLWIWFNIQAIFILITLGLLVFYELPNLKSKSWEYYTKPYVVVSGWFPMVFAFRLAYIILPVELINSIVRSIL